MSALKLADKFIAAGRSIAAAPLIIAGTLLDDKDIGYDDGYYEDYHPVKSGLVICASFLLLPVSVAFSAPVLASGWTIKAVAGVSRALLSLQR